MQPREEAQRGRGARVERREDLGHPHLREDEERERLRGRVPGSAGKLPPASTSLGRGARRLQKSIAGLRGGARGGRGAARPGEAGAARA